MTAYYIGGGFRLRKIKVRVPRWFFWRFYSLVERFGGAIRS